ncbi:hypothetical protein Tco_0557094 [Tanacetum coccineum]
MVLRILVISACVHAKTSAFDFKSIDVTEDPFLVCGMYPSGPLCSFVNFVYREYSSDSFFVRPYNNEVKSFCPREGSSPIVISNGTSPMDQKRSPVNPTRGVFKSTLVALMVGLSF